MVLAVALAMSCLSRQGNLEKVDDPQMLQICSSFFRATDALASSAGGGFSSITYASPSVFHDTDSDFLDEYYVVLGNASARVKTDSRVIFAHLTDIGSPADRLWDETKAMPEKSVRAIVSGIAESAKFANSVRFGEITADRAHLCFRTTFFPEQSGYRYANEYGGQIDIDYESGQFRNAMLRPYPVAPDPMPQPRISSNTARGIMTDYVFGHKSVAWLTERQPLELVLWSPHAIGAFKEDQHFSDQNLALQTQNRAMLVYCAIFSDAEKYIPSLNSYGATFICYVDPMTGAFIDCDHTWPSGGGSRAVPLNSVSTFNWNWTGESVRIARGRNAALVSGATAAPAPALPLSFKTPATVLLTRGRLTVRCEYDQHSGLIRTHRSNPIYGKPGHKLKLALDRLLNHPN